MSRLRLPPQILRLVLLTIGIIGSYMVARAFLTPHSFGEYGHYRGDALEEIAARARTFAGRQSCDECHSEQFQQVLKFEHKTLSCESCHGPAQMHVDNPDLKLNKPTDNDCLRCHESNVSRPVWLKQVVPQDHFRGDRCISCHLPHQPNEVP
jgi:hypothetical protein